MISINKTTTDYEPVKSLVFYKSKEEHETKIYAECANIVNGKALAYHPLNKIQLRDISSKISKQLKKGRTDINIDLTSQKLDREILKVKVSGDRISALWLVKSRKDIYEYNDKSGIITYPNLIFKVANSKLHIYAVKKNNVNDKTVIYKAPFPNIYENGSMCFGTMQFSKFYSNDLIKLMDNMEQAFFNSKFGELMSENRSKSNTFSLFEELVKTNGVFPNDELVKTKYKLKDVYK